MTITLSTVLAEPVRLRAQPQIRVDFDAYPIVTGGVASLVGKKINAVLTQMNERAKRALAECLAEDPKSAYWERGVEVTMNGPRYLSLVSHDNIFCGGAHPNNGNNARVFDLRNGNVVDFSRLLPALVSKGEEGPESDGVSVSRVTSPKLIELYREDMQKDAARQDDCKSALDDQPRLSFIVFPDAKQQKVDF